MPRIFDSVDHLANAMSFHRDRHAVLAGNIANLDTPGYRPADLERQVLPAGAPAGTVESRMVFDSGGALSGPDGNAVALEHELSKIDANRVRYGASAELVTRRLALLRYAAGDGNG